ncbi:MAG: tyrosine-type recombinase/integrase [Thermoleophilia bacterium]
MHYFVRTDHPDAGKHEKPKQQEQNGEGETVRSVKDKWTVACLWDEYQAANPDLKGMSIYRAIFNAHLSRPFGNMRPAEITPFDLDRLKLDQMKGRSPKSIANALELLRRIVNFGVRRGLCPGLRFTLQLPRVNNQKTEDLTGEELGRLVSVLDRHLSLKSSRLVGAAMMKLVLYTGMRRGEIFRLKWSDLDFHRNNILLREPKGGRDVIIPMSNQARLLLESLKTHECDKQAGSDKPPGRDRSSGSDYVFPGKDGGQRRDVRKQVNAIKIEAELPEDFRPLHGLRHVFASGLVSSGVEFQIVQRLLTHKGGTVTHRYAHIRDDALRAAAQLAGQLVEQASPAGCFLAQRE